MNKQVSVNTLEVAVYFLVLNNGFDPVDGGGMAFCGNAATVFSKNILYLVIPVVEGRGKVCSSSAGFAATDKAIFNEYYLFACFGERISGIKN